MHGLVNTFHSNLCRRHFNAAGIFQQELRQLFDLRRHGGREKQTLPCRRNQLCDFAHVMDKPHVKHAVSFVEHEVRDGVEPHAIALHEIKQTARRCDQYLPVDLHREFAEDQSANHFCCWQPARFCPLRQGDEGDASDNNNLVVGSQSKVPRVKSRTWNRRDLFPICTASSRVGARIRARTIFAGNRRRPLLSASAR